MTIIVTGAAGFLGRAVVRALLGASHDVLAADRVDSTGVEGARYFRSDLSDPSDRNALFSAAGRDATLVHLAWDMRRHQGFAVQGACVSMTAALLDAAAEHGVSRVIALGSADEYGAAGGVMREDTPPAQPLTPYGWAKRAARDLASTWCLKTGIPTAWLRPFIVYGPGQRGDLMIPYAIEQARRRLPAEFTDGMQRRDFLYVDDAADAVRAAVQATLSGFEEFNLGTGVPTQVANILRAIAQQFDVESLFRLGARARRPGEPDEFVADPRRAAERLGWRARTDWRTGIERACQFEQ